jgi:hypothetical protein
MTLTFNTLIHFGWYMVNFLNTCVNIGFSRRNKLRGIRCKFVYTMYASRALYEMLTEVLLKIQGFWDDAVSIVKYLPTFLRHRNPLERSVSNCKWARRKFPTDLNLQYTFGFPCAQFSPPLSDHLGDRLWDSERLSILSCMAWHIIGRTKPVGPSERIIR